MWLSSTCMQQWAMMNRQKFSSIPGFMQSLCIVNNMQNGLDRLKSYCSKRCGNNSEVLGVEWAAAGISISCPVRASSVPHTLLLNTCPGGYDNHSSGLHQYSPVAQIRVLHGLISRPYIMTSMNYRTLEYCENHRKWLVGNGDTFQSDELSY